MPEYEAGCDNATAEDGRRFSVAWGIVKYVGGHPESAIYGKTVDNVLWGGMMLTPIENTIDPACTE